MIAPVVFSSGFKVAFVATWKVSCGELRDCFTRCTNPQLSQLVAKCEQILCIQSCEFDERGREVKICWRSRPALNYSEQQSWSYRARWKTRHIRQVVSSCIEYIVAAFKAATYEVFLFIYFAAFRTVRSHSFFFAVHACWRTACVQRNLKVISIKSHGKSLLFGYYKRGFRCLELTYFSPRCFELKDLNLKKRFEPLRKDSSCLRDHQMSQMYVAYASKSDRSVLSIYI